MKRLLPLLLALSCLLTACSPDNTPASPSPSDAAAAETTPAASTPSPESTPAPTPSAPSGEQISSHTFPPDYSDHAEKYPDEDKYITWLADLSLLAQGQPALTRKVPAADWSWMEWDGKKEDIWGYDLRSSDVSGKDLSGILNGNDISFNSDTVWPSAKKLPQGFDPDAILELSKDPGLGVRDLHAQGITGEGVGIAILDQSLFSDHEQYRDNLMLYESIHATDSGEGDMHGSAVASIAVGKDIGVAPGAKLYFIDSDFGHRTENGFEDAADVIADGIYRVLEINRALPEGEKIRVISISKGVMADTPGIAPLISAIDAAKKENVLVLTTSTNLFYPFSFGGMCRDGLSDPNDPQSYRAAPWVLKAKPDQLTVAEDEVLVPMGGRTYAACTGESDYEWGYEGGMSWAVPWMAGFYALCCQADPDCTPERFFEAVQSTATLEMHRGIDGPGPFYGRVIDPAAAVEALKNQ